MEIQAIKCNKCKTFIDITIGQHVTHCSCSNIWVDKNPNSNIFRIGQGDGDFTILWADVEGKKEECDFTECDACDDNEPCERTK